MWAEEATVDVASSQTHGRSRSWGLGVGKDAELPS